MEKRTSAFARIFAVLALAAAVAAVILILSGAVDDSSDKGARNGSQQQEKKQEKPTRPTQATYEIKPGDTLTRISAKTGVPVEELIDLNPEVDPQILIAGETLKLR